MTGASTRITVGGARPYDVVVGRDVLDELPGLIGSGRRVLLAHPEGLAHVAGPVQARLAAAGIDVAAFGLPDGEAQKDIAVAARLWDALAAHRVARGDAVVAVGGGATTDVAGFVAATWLRGVAVVHVPTTLLAMVDAAVGGKTAVNTAAGKNLVGAFHPPAGVLCDLDLLAGVPPADHRAGLAEVVKVGFTHDPRILALVEADPAAAVDPGSPVTRELVERAVRVKAGVVSEDLTEQGARELLNYGHTLAHAVERVTGYSCRHGDAVSVGLVYAAALGRLAGRLDRPTADRHAAILVSLGLPTRCGLPWGELHEAMRVDKKGRDGRLRFVVLEGPGRAGMLEDPPAGMLQDAYAELRHGAGAELGVR